MVKLPDEIAHGKRNEPPNAPLRRADAADRRSARRRRRPDLHPDLHPERRLAVQPRRRSGRGRRGWDAVLVEARRQAALRAALRVALRAAFRSDFPVAGGGLQRSVRARRIAFRDRRRIRRRRRRCGRRRREKRIAGPPRHAPAAAFGVRPGLGDLAGRWTRTGIAFSPPRRFTGRLAVDRRPGASTHLLLAWSRHAAFDRHSASRGRFDLIL